MRVLQRTGIRDRLDLSLELMIKSRQYPVADLVYIASEQAPESLNSPSLISRALVVRSLTQDHPSREQAPGGCTWMGCFPGLRKASPLAFLAAELRLAISRFRTSAITMLGINAQAFRLRVLSFSVQGPVLHCADCTPSPLQRVICRNQLSISLIRWPHMNYTANALRRYMF